MQDESLWTERASWIQSSLRMACSTRSQQHAAFTAMDVHSNERKITLIYATLISFLEASGIYVPCRYSARWPPIVLITSPYLHNWGEPERAPHSRDSCERSWSALSVHITSPHVLRTWSWSGLGTSCTVQLRVHVHGVWHTLLREQQKPLKRERSQATTRTRQSGRNRRIEMIDYRDIESGREGARTRDRRRICLSEERRAAARAREQQKPLKREVRLQRERDRAAETR